MPQLSTIYDYMRANASLLGARILLEYPALHQFEDPVSPRIAVSYTHLTLPTICSV